MNEQSVLNRSTYLSWVEVNLDAIRHNYRTVRNFLPGHVDLFPVVKADAYGHGAVRVVKLLEQEGVNRVCVARVEEGVELRNAGVSCNILVFTPPPFLSQALAAIENALEVVVCDESHIESVLEAQRQTGSVVPVHIKTDVGMGRVGTRPETVPEMLSRCTAAGISVVGIMSHFPCADEPDRTVTEKMANSFNEVVTAVSGMSKSNLHFHVSNTAAMLRFPNAWHNAVRSGISLYGQYPSYEMERPLDLQPAMTLKTRIVYIKDVPADTPISYGGIYRTPWPSRIATLALGYADGYPRHASNRTEFLIRGKRVPQVGRVCMDQLMVDVTSVPGVGIGDEVVAFGQTSDGALQAEEVAARFESLGYELTSRIGKRLPRFYIGNES